MRGRCQEEFLENRKPSHRKRQRVQRKCRQSSVRASTTTTDVSTFASDVDQNSSIEFEAAEFDDFDDHDNDKTEPIKSEQASHSEVDVLENIHFLNQSIDKLNDQVGQISSSAVAMIDTAVKRLTTLQRKLNGDSANKQKKNDADDGDRDWVDISDRNRQETNTRYDISVNMCQHDANRLMQNGHIFFNDGKLCFSTRKKKA